MERLPRAPGEGLPLPAVGDTCAQRIAALPAARRTSQEEPISHRRRHGASEHGEQALTSSRSPALLRGAPWQPSWGLAPGAAPAPPPPAD